jgi:hypothetical protein
MKQRNLSLVAPLIFGALGLTFLFLGHRLGAIATRDMIHVLAPGMFWRGPGMVGCRVAEPSGTIVPPPPTFVRSRGDCAQRSPPVTKVISHS